MRRLLWLGLAAVGLVALLVVGSLANFLGRNQLFLDSPWALAALVTGGLVAAVVLGLIGLAGPRRGWLDSPYW